MANLPSLWKGSLWNERRNPYRAFDRMRQEMDDIFENFMRNTWDIDVPTFTLPRNQPLCDLEERDTHYLLSFDMPGMSKDDIRVEIRDNQLHVIGERRQEHEERRGQRLEAERTFGSFERWLSLPTNAKAEGIEARVENGVLQIAIPKAEVARGKEIKVIEGRGGIFNKLLGKKEQAA